MGAVVADDDADDSATTIASTVGVGVNGGVLVTDGSGAAEDVATVSAMNDASEVAACSSDDASNAGVGLTGILG